jgi:predicted component of type VI protein secretion system
MLDGNFFLPNTNGLLAQKPLVEFLENDINNLLKSRSLYASNFYEYGGLLTNYGLPDFSYYNLSSAEDQEKVSTIIKDCLINFEPRLRDLCIITRAIKNKNVDINFYTSISAVVEFVDITITIIIEPQFDIKLNKLYVKIKD